MARERVRKTPGSSHGRLGRKRDEQKTETKAAPAGAFVHTSRRGVRYTLCEVSTKRGGTRLVMAREPRGTILGELPKGYEVAENPNGQVSVRRRQVSAISPAERSDIERLLRSRSKHARCKAEFKGRDVLIHELQGGIDPADPIVGLLLGMSGEDPRTFGGRYQAMLRFRLLDAETRTFTVARYCFRGSIDGWLDLYDEGPLATLARRYLPHIGEESFYELC